MKSAVFHTITDLIMLVFVIIFYFAMPSGTNFFYMAAAIIITFVINRIADAFFFSLAPSMRLDIK